MPADVTDSFVPVPGGEIFVRRWQMETAKRAPIVLLHDSLGSVELWRDFPAALADATGRSVIAYDRLGFGNSTPRTDSPSARFILEESDVYFPALRDALNLTRFSLFGHSVGGAMALTIAARQSRGCESVIAESAQAFVEQRTLDGIGAASLAFGDPIQFARLSKWHGERTRWVLDAWIDVWLSADFSDWSLDPYLADVGCPVLSIHGDRDEYGSVEFPRRISSGVSGPSTMTVLADCGHVPHRERLSEVLRLATEFLAGP